MPFYDKKCKSCQAITVDVLEAVYAAPALCTCGGELERVWLGKASSVIPDDIPGGIFIKNGLCNADGSPRKYYSKTEMKQEAARRGLVNHVTHIGERGSDKNKHTTRWV